MLRLLYRIVAWFDHFKRLGSLRLEIQLMLLNRRLIRLPHQDNSIVSLLTIRINMVRFGTIVFFPPPAHSLDIYFTCTLRSHQLPYRHFGWCLLWLQNVRFWRKLVLLMLKSDEFEVLLRGVGFPRGILQWLIHRVCVLCDHHYFTIWLLFLKDVLVFVFRLSC